MTLPQVVAHEAGADLLQAGEIQPLDPVLPQIAAQQVLHHARMSEQQLVTVVVLGHSRVSSPQGL
ncbi:MAG TPA: hypothetical protein VJ885_03745 [Thermoanaerobaculia bacterium]|nr:hypothetical protein [Thermoanaerobaculia bacterium]